MVLRCVAIGVIVSRSGLAAANSVVPFSPRVFSGHDSSVVTPFWALAGPSPTLGSMATDQAMLTAVKGAITAQLSANVAKYTVGNQSFEKLPLSELRQVRLRCHRQSYGSAAPADPWVRCPLESEEVIRRHPK
jgi:hypothetical protein